MRPTEVSWGHGMEEARDGDGMPLWLGGVGIVAANDREWDVGKFVMPLTTFCAITENDR